MRFWSNLSIKAEKAKNHNVYSNYIYEGNYVAWIIQQLLFRNFKHIAFITFTRGKVLCHCLEHFPHSKK